MVTMIMIGWLGSCRLSNKCS